MTRRNKHHKESYQPSHASVSLCASTEARTTEITAGPEPRPALTGRPSLRGVPEKCRDVVETSAEPRLGPNYINNSNPDGSSHSDTNIHTFQDLSGGSGPEGNVTQKSNSLVGTNRLEGDHGMGRGRLSPGLAHNFPGGSSHPLDDLQSTPLRMSNANNLKYSNPIMDPKYTNISDSSSEVGQMYGDEVMLERIADDKKAPASSSQTSDITITLYPINHKLLYQPSSHIRNNSNKINLILSLT